MSTQLSFLELPGVDLTERTLTIPKAVTDESLVSIGSRLLAVHGCYRWALGAVLTDMLYRRPLKDRKGQPTGEHDDTWLNEFAEAHAIDPKEKREMMAVHLFYPVEARTFNLSYEHYKVAMMEAGTLADALPYLKQAEAKDWKHTELRRHIRLSQAKELPDTTQSTFHGYSILFDFRRFIAKEFPHPEELTPDRARLLLDDLGEETVAFVDRLREIAKAGR